MNRTLEEALRDEQRETYKLKSVELEHGGLSVDSDSGFNMFMSADRAKESGVDLAEIAPLLKAGDTVQIWGRGLGYRWRGLAIGEHLLYYQTEAEDAAAAIAEVQAMNDKKKAEYETSGKADLTARAAKLPPIFFKRLAGFHGRNPDFGWKHAGYETFCCEQAVLIANTLKTPEAVEAFGNAEYAEQDTMVPELSKEHSGNTLGAAIGLAYWYLKEPKYVPEIHGALCPLVGCEAYGCYSTVANKQ